jgi:hypothetical protein
LFITDHFHPVDGRSVELVLDDDSPIQVASRRISLRAQQRFDRPAFVHRAVSLGYLLEGQRQVVDLARVESAVPHPVDQVGKIAAYECGLSVER